MTSFSVAVSAVVPFDAVISNVGSHFHTNGSFFVCPFDGVYEFAVYITTSQNAWVCITHNSVTIATAYIEYAVSGDTGAGGNSVIVQCARDDVVQVEATTTSHLLGGRYLMFTGRLLFIDESEKPFILLK